MGRSEEAEASIGLKIVLSDLILQLNEKNLLLIKKMLSSGYIEDENNFFNEEYKTIIYDNNFDSDNVEQFKELFLKEKDGLFDRVLLIPVKKILLMERWGHDRSGTNAVYRPIDFDLSIDIEKYKEIEKTEIVFLLRQHAG